MHNKEILMNVFLSYDMKSSLISLKSVLYITGTIGNLCVEEFYSMIVRVGLMI